MKELRTGTLQWAIATFCLLMGALILVVPQPYAILSVEIFQHRLSFGTLWFFLAGAALICAALFAARPRFSVLAHLLAGGVLGILVMRLAALEIWSEAIAFAILAAGITLPPLLERTRRLHPDTECGDLFALLLGLAAAAIGLAWLSFPGQFSSPTYQAIQIRLPWYGSAFLLLGLALAAVQVVPALPQLLIRAVHISFAVLFLAFVTDSNTGAWIPFVLYMGGGMVILLLPWLGPRMQRVDPSSIYIRLALVMAITAALPLVVSVALITRQDDRQSVAQALEFQHSLAELLARDINSYLVNHRAAIAAIAAHPGLASASPQHQQEMLESFPQVSQGLFSFAAFATYDASGRPIARSGNRSLIQSSDEAALFQRVQQTEQPAQEIYRSLAEGKPVLIFADPIRDQAGQFAGAVLGSLELERLSAHLSTAKMNASDTIYLVDERGHILAHTDAGSAAMLNDASALPPVEALLDSTEHSGALRYGSGRDERLAGYATVPAPGWGVVVEGPTVVALAGLTSGRNLAFTILLLAIGTALTIGMLAARGLTATLATLVRAVNQLETGDTDPPLPYSTISEIAHLSAAFGALRAHLSTRTTERDLAEAALRASEERYRTIVETAQEGIWLFDAGGRTTFVNPALTSMLGCRAEEIIGKPLMSFADILAVGGQAHPPPSISEQHEFPLRRKDGTTLWTIMFTNPLRDKQGRFSGALATVIDITQRKQTEQALRESEARFRTMADSAPVLIWMSNPDGRGIFFNQTWLHFTGRSLEQEMGYGWSDGIHPQDVERCADISQSAYEQRAPFQMEYRLRRADGQHRWLLEEGMPRFTPDGIFIGYIGSCVDITERKRAESVLHFLVGASTTLTDSLDYTTTLANVTRLIVPTLADWCVVNIMADDGSIQQVAVAHADPTREGLIHELHQRYPPDSDEPHAIWQVLQTGQSKLVVDSTDSERARATSDPAQLAIRRELGETSYMTVPLLARGRTLGAISLVLGDSERRYSAEDLAVAEEIAYRVALAVDNARLYHEAQAAVQARDQFLSIASHELKTPLTALVGYVKLLRRRFTPGNSLTERDLRAIHVIDEQSSRLNRLISLLLDLSRIQKEQLSIDPAPLDLSLLVRRVVNDMELIVERHSILVETPDHPLYINGDEMRLEQVLHNLLQNAIKYSPSGGIIRVCLEAEAETACIRVTDQGIGIPREAMHRLFQRFQRISNPDTQHVSGLGLGLYIVKEIVLLHGGHVNVASEEGIGSTFTVYLPLHAPTRQPLMPIRQP